MIWGNSNFAEITFSSRACELRAEVMRAESTHDDHRDDGHRFLSLELSSRGNNAKQWALVCRRFYCLSLVGEWPLKSKFGVLQGSARAASLAAPPRMLHTTQYIASSAGGSSNKKKKPAASQGRRGLSTRQRNPPRETGSCDESARS